MVHKYLCDLRRPTHCQMWKLKSCQFFKTNFFSKYDTTINNIHLIWLNRMISSVTGKLNITLVHIIYNNNWVFKTLSLTLHRISPGIFTYLDMDMDRSMKTKKSTNTYNTLNIMLHFKRNLNNQPSWIQITQ